MSSARRRGSGAGWRPAVGVLAAALVGAVVGPAGSGVVPGGAGAGASVADVGPVTAGTGPVVADADRAAGYLDARIDGMGGPGLVVSPGRVIDPAVGLSTGPGGEADDGPVEPVQGPGDEDDEGPEEPETPEPVEVDDPLRDLQWYLDSIRAPQAWAITQGSPEVVIAVIDTGVDPEHPDLADAFWIEPFSGANGYDHLLGRFQTFVEPEQDWHGTAVAGIAAARADDGFGMAGVAPRVQVMVHRIYASASFSEPPTDATYPRAVRAIREAVATGADVILITWGGTEPSIELLTAIREAGVPVVVAAGNDGQDLSDDPEVRRFPAMYRHPNLITVASSDQQGRLVGGDRVPTNFGIRHVDIAAPGVDIVSVRAGGGHAYHEGTSFAAPQVAAALALGRTFAPGLSASELIGAMNQSARTSIFLRGRVTSGGVLDVAAFLRALERPICGDVDQAPSFTDVGANGVHAPSIACLEQLGVALGGEDGRFRPRSSITRGQMASFLVRVLEAAGEDLPTDVERRFDDIDGSVHADNIDILAELGLVAGTGDGSFSPDRSVTRGQMATFVTSVVGYLGEPVLGPDRDWFDDVDGTTHEASILLARELGITLGTTEPRRFEPGASMTREQMATFLSRTVDTLGRLGVAVEPRG